jgi:ADP-heptose:LPS heptosyltransferase
MSDAETGNFLTRTRNVRKIMVLDLGFLGDTVHLLPALWMVRQAYPQAQLHVAVASHITSLMSCAPWVDRVWGYMRYPRHATLRENLDMVRRLRREKFDVLINLNGSDRSSWLTFFSGARERLGRVPKDGGPLFWKQMFTAQVYSPWDEEPVYLQRCHCLEKAGFPFVHPEFHTDIAPENLRTADIGETDHGTYFHISPFTTADYKELSPKHLVELIAALEKNFPEKKIVLSCAPAARELAKMEQLLAHLPQKPWRVFAGNLNLPQVTAVIKNSALHFCGDTGTLHLALMTQTPAVAWFWPNPALKSWFPADEKYRVIIGSNPAGGQYLEGATTTALIQQAQSLMKSLQK